MIGGAVQAAADARVDFEVVDAVGVIRLVNPPVNALTHDMRNRLREIAEQVSDRSDVRAVVLTSSGDRSLSVGSDIKQFPRSVAEGRAVSANEHLAYEALENMPQPLVAVIRGHTLGGGLELALVADLRVAESTASIGLPEVLVGVFASGGGTQRLPEIIGGGRARHLLLLGETIDAVTAESWGLVTSVVAEGEGEGEAMRIARRLAELPQRALRATKRCVNAGLRYGRAVGEQDEIECIAEVYGSADAQEGASAFLEKRAPKFTHI